MTLADYWSKDRLGNDVYDIWFQDGVAVAYWAGNACQPSKFVMFTIFNLVPKSEPEPIVFKAAVPRSMSSSMHPVRSIQSDFIDRIKCMGDDYSKLEKAHRKLSEKYDQLLSMHNDFCHKKGLEVARLLRKISQLKKPVSRAALAVPSAVPDYLL